MIEKGTKIYKKSVTRILEIDQEAKQVNFLDTRFYKKGDHYYPSITSVLQFFPKNFLLLLLGLVTTHSIF
jgi:hypothetical protein